MIRVNSLLIFFLSVSLFACSQSGKKVQIPEVGIYSSVTTSVENQYEWEFNPFTKQMEMRLKPHVQIMPSAFGRLEIKANGTYEFIDQKKGGAYKYDEKTKKINFTGYMEAGEATFSYSKSTCILLINVKGKTFSLQYEKASTRPLSETQPDLKTPNADFSGTIVAALGYQSVDYIDLSSAKTTTTFSYTGYTKASGAGQTIHLEEPDRIVNFSLEEPLLEIRDKAGNKLFSYKAKSASGKEWKIARYTGAMLSPDETKFVLTGQQWDAVESYGINIRKYIKAVAGVFNISNGELKTLLDIGEKYDWTASWLPSGGILKPTADGGIIVTDAQFKNEKTIYTQKVDLALCSPSGKKILFKKGSQLFTINIDGSGEQQVTNKNVSLNFDKTRISDVCFSPDSKSMALSMPDEFLSNNYTVILLSLDGEKSSMLKNIKGETLIFRWPTISWIGNGNTNNVNKIIPEQSNQTSVENTNTTTQTTTQKIKPNPATVYQPSPGQHDAKFTTAWDYYTKVMADDIENFNDPAAALTYIICLNYCYYYQQQTIPTNQVQKIYTQFAEKLLMDKNLKNSGNDVKQQLTEAIILDAIKTFVAVNSNDKDKIKAISMKMMTKYIGKAATNLKITDNGMEY